MDGRQAVSGLSYCAGMDVFNMLGSIGLGFDSRKYVFYTVNIDTAGGFWIIISLR